MGQTLFTVMIAVLIGAPVLDAAVGPANARAVVGDAVGTAGDDRDSLISIRDSSKTAQERHPARGPARARLKLREPDDAPDRRGFGRASADASDAKAKKLPRVDEEPGRQRAWSEKSPASSKGER